MRFRIFFSLILKGIIKGVGEKKKGKAISRYQIPFRPSFWCKKNNEPLDEGRMLNREVQFGYISKSNEPKSKDL